MGAVISLLSCRLTSSSRVVFEEIFLEPSISCPFGSTPEPSVSPFVSTL